MDPRQRRLISNRIGVMQALALGLVGALLLVYGWLQLVRHRDYSSQAENQAVKVRALPAPRGIVYDRSGHPLADNRKALHLVVNREELPAKPEVVEELAEALGLEAEDLARKIRSYRSAGLGRPLVLEENLDEAGIANAERVRARFPFLSIQVAPRRVYLGSELAGHVLGYVGEVDEKLMKTQPGRFQLGEIVGRAGFEASGNDRLKGRDGEKRILVDQVGKEVTALDRTDPKPGRSLYLTLDAGLQQEAEQAFREKDEKGAAVVIDLRDGGILALYSSPSYDPNLFLNRLSQDMVDRYLRNAERPMLNRVTQGIYAPGSTWKLLMAIAGLEKGVITPATVFYCGGHKDFYGRTFRCDNVHGSVDLISAIQRSCDIYFYEVAQRLDIDDIHAVAKKYGLTVPTGIDLPHELAPRIPSRAWKAEANKHGSKEQQKWYAGETISVGIGQGAVGLTPISLARFYGVLGTRGRMLTPHLFYGLRDEGGDLVKYDPPPPQSTGLDPKVAAILDEGLARVVSGGTAATSAEVRAVAKLVPFVGKTGTAQVATFVDKAHYARQAKELKDHAWFAGYAPRGNPQIAFAVIVENAGFGADNAAPIAAKLVKYWFVDRLTKPLPPPGSPVAPEPFQSEAEESAP